MQNNINIINIRPSPLPTNAQSRKRYSTCRPHLHGRHQPPPSPPLHGGQIHTHGSPSWHVRQAEGRHSGPEILGKHCKNRWEMPPSPPLPTNAQNTKQQEKHNTEAAFAWTSSPPPPSPPSPHQCNALEHTRTMSTKETEDTRCIRIDVITPPPHPPPHPRTELKYKCKSKLACAKSRESAKTP